MPRFSRMPRSALPPVPAAVVATAPDQVSASLRTTLPWWMSPTGQCLGFLLPILFLIAYVGQAGFSGLTVRGLRFLSPTYLALGAVLLVVSALAGWVGQHLQVRGPGRGAMSSSPGVMGAPSRQWDVAATLVAVVALFAYLVWFKSFFLSPSLLLQTLTGAYRPDRSNIEVTIGVTSLANVAPVFFSIYAYRLAFAGPRIHPAAHAMAAVLVPLTVFRVYAWSERLALIEASVPFGLALGAMACRSPRRWVRVLVWGGPFIALPALVLYFGMAEYVRSWTSPAYAGKLNFWDFAIGRIASYYYTSLNNGAGLLATLDWPTFAFEHTLYWLHRAPLSVGPLFSSWIDLPYFQTEVFLEKFADPEFNNPSGLYAVVCDLGLPLGIAYFAAVALAGGLLFRAYGEGRLLGALLYPIIFLSFLEVYRYPYLGQSRAFTWVLGMILMRGLLAVQTYARRGQSAAAFSDARSSRPRPAVSGRC